MENIFNRLQFVRGLNPNKESGVFDTREDAYNYVLTKHLVERPSLVGEPIVLLYESEDASKGPNVILAIGSVGEGTSSQSNRTFFIDTKKTEEEFEDLREYVEEAIKSLLIIPVETDTIKLNTEKTSGGTLLSGDVKIADYRIVDNKVETNIIETEGEKGIFAFVDMDYDPNSFKITFTVNGVSKEFQLPADQHVTKGWYDPKIESIVLKLADNSKVEVPVSKLIEEWTVLEEASDTPITLFKEHVSAITEGHEGLYDWQDILTADVRVADHISDNILHKDRTGRYLYVKGTADNIKYKDGQTVKDALDNADTKVSTSTGNLIYKRPDGIYAYSMLGYNQAENKLTYTYSDGNTGENNTIEFQLNSVKLLEDITYDPVKECIVIRYIDTQGQYQRVEIPVKDIIEEWTVNNESHNVELTKYRSAGQGADILSADVKIHNGDDNILEDKYHTLYVKGTSDNIKHKNSTVKEALDELNTHDEILGAKIDDEIARANTAENALDVKIDQEIADRIADVDEEEERAKAEEEKLETIIGSGFTTDAHETITYKFNELTNGVEEESARAIEKETALENKIDNEIARSTSKDEEIEGKVDSLETNIGDGFGPRNTVRDEFDKEKEERENADELLTDKINELSANTEGRLESISNVDKSIDVDNTDAVNPIIKVNLSESSPYNTIRLERDGIYNFIDLVYDPDTNKLSLIRSDKSSTENVVKELQLNSISVIDGIEYDPSTETLIIKYHSGSEQKELRIPLGEILQEWEVYNDPDSAVKLNRERNVGGKDKLSGIVVLSPKVGATEDNIIENINGALYVPGSQISANTQAISVERARAEAAEASLQTSINDEKERAEATESGLASSIESENARAEAAEEALQSAINAEKTRAESAETILHNEIGIENVRAISAETSLQNAINSEKLRAEAIENSLQTSILNEVNRSTAKDDELSTAISTEASTRETIDNQLRDAITTETLRAQNADNELYQKIADEISDRTVADSTISANVSQEISRAQVAENSISERLSSEVTRSTNEDQALRDLINAESSARLQGDSELSESIREATLTFDDTDSIDFTKTSGNVVTADVKLQGGDNIIKLGSGLYATATLEYEPTGNKIRLVTSNGAQEYIQLVGATLLDSIEYDSVNKLLIIKYTDGTGSHRETSVGVTDLWNEWIVDNPSENSAIELTKTIGDSGNADTISGKVLISDREDNAIEIIDNHLYVSNADITGTSAAVECIKGELKSAENAIFGQAISQECGEGFVYVAPNGSTYITGATNINNATYILDQAIKNTSAYTENVENSLNDVSDKVDCTTDELKIVETRILGMTLTGQCGNGDNYRPNEGTNYIVSASSFNGADIILDREIKKANDAISEVNTELDNTKDDLECTKNSLKKTQEVILGVTVPACGEGATYTPTGGHILSAATSMYNADVKLEAAIEDMASSWNELLVGSETPTTHMYTIDIGQNRHLRADVRLSHGNLSAMTDNDLVITDFNGETVEHGKTIFTDTNVLKYVDVTGLGYTTNTAYNGLYLSNIWDCGKYYDEETEAAEIAEMQAEGYNTSYKTDTDSSASGYNYMNNVRQQDI